jgi:hypothetical protein
VSKISSGFPAVVAGVVALPLDKILVLVSVFVAVQYMFNLVFEFVIDLNWWGWGWVLSIYVVAGPGGEAVHMKDGMLTH